MQLKIGDWNNWNKTTQMVEYEFVNARRQLDKMKQYHVQLEYNSTKDE